MRTAVLLLLSLPALAAAQAPDYQRAEQMLTWNALRHVTGDQVAPTWYRDSTRFWYRVMTPRGAEFVTVNPVAGTRAPLFDNARLAAAISRAADTAVAPGTLPFRTFTFADDGRDERRIHVRVGALALACDLTAYRCARTDTLPDRMRFVRSPDEQWDAFLAGHNLWVRRVGGADSVPLTTDGVAGHAYGAPSPTPTLLRRKMPTVPDVAWSPDSRRLVVSRIDERGVRTFRLYSSTTLRPTAYEYPVALPGDSVVPMVEHYVVDVGTRTSRKVALPAQPLLSFYAFGDKAVQWAPTSDRLYLTHVNRGPKKVELHVADMAGSVPRRLLADSAPSYVIGALDLTAGARNWRPLRNGDLLWFAERDGWGHLYHLGPDGAVKHQVTSGDWVVTALLGVDEALGRVYFTARGRGRDGTPSTTTCTRRRWTARG
jgi:hypothetical protein